MSENNRLSYIPSLESFRFFAVALVMVSHWIPGSILNTIPNGFLGVTFFFVLSGFLISSNLLLAKRKVDAGASTVGKAIKTFYIRRSLRIFPLYYLIIFSVYALVPAVYDGNLGWFVAYIPNFLIYKLQDWPGMLSHFWSLGVEEQFYFIWPFLILFTPGRLLKYLFPLVLLFSLVFKFYHYLDSEIFFGFYDALPLSCFDSFAVGGLLAYVSLSPLEDKVKQLSYRWFWLIFFSSVLVCIAVLYLGFSFLFGLAVSVSSALLIFQAARGYQGIEKIVLDNSVLQYLGKISYGLYIYHNFMPWLVRCIRGAETRYPLSIPSIDLGWFGGTLQTVVLQFVILVIISSLSWFFIENPINNLKKHFAQ